MATPRTKEPVPDLGTDRLDKARYLSAEVASLELSRVFGRSWLYAVPSGDVAQPGSWATFEIGDSSILVSRTDEGELVAHHNVCQHRGRRLVDSERGRSAAFRCAYHAWTYRLDGSLRTVHEPAVFSAGLDPCHLGLRPVRVDEWGGLVWICLDSAAPPLQEYLSPLPEHLSCYPLHRLSIRLDQSVVWECNWKVAVDAFHETYHNLATHPQLMPSAGDVNVQIDCYGRHSRFLLPSGVPAPAYRHRERPTPAQIASFARYDFDASTFEGTADEVLPVFQRHKRRWMLDRGYEVEELGLEQFTENYHYTVFPNTQISFYPDRLLVTRSRPHPSGHPARMVFDLQLFGYDHAGEPTAARPVTQYGEGADFPLEPDFVRQDAVNMVAVQRGLASPGFGGARLSDLELRIRHWHSQYDRVMADVDD